MNLEKLQNKRSLKIEEDNDNKVKRLPDLEAFLS